MLICALGTPSAYAAYGFNLVYTIARAALGDVQFIPACTPDQLKAAFEERKGRPVLLSSDNLDVRIMDTLVRAGAPILAFIEGAEDSVGFTMKARDVDIRNAVQMYAQSIACLAPYLSAPSLQLYWRPDGATPITTVIERICDGFGFTLTDHQMQMISATLIPAGVDPLTETLDDQLRRFHPAAAPIGGQAVAYSRDDQRLIEEALGAYLTLLAGQLPVFNWPTGLFRDSHHPEQSILGPMDLTGPARLLMFGPLLHLPPGFWRAHIAFWIGENLSGNVLYSDVVADNQIINTGETPLPPAGVFSYEIDFPVRDPRHPVAVRLGIQSGAIEGMLQIMAAEARFVAALPTGPGRG